MKIIASGVPQSEAPRAELAPTRGGRDPAGRKAGIDERSLFTGPESRVAKYASRELLDFFDTHPRPTRVSHFGNAAQRRAHLAGRRIGALHH